MAPKLEASRMSAKRRKLKFPNPSLIFKIIIIIILFHELELQFQLVQTWQIEPIGGQAATSACDKLFASFHDMTEFCQCRESGSEIPEFEAKYGAENGRKQVVQINQLDCTPNSLTDLLILGQKPLIGEERFSIHSLNFNTNFTNSQAIVGPREKPAEVDEQHQALAADHLSLQLKVSKPNKIGNDLEDFLVKLGSLIELESIKSLSFLIDSEAFTGRFRQLSRTEVNLGKFLSKFKRLVRLELSSSNRNIGWQLHGNSMRKLNQLKWLNLNSNNEVNFWTPGTFKSLQNLEYLNLEFCNLRKFSLPRQFDGNFSLDYGGSNNYYFGSKSLSSLNLASNKLKSLMLDLFSNEEFPSLAWPSRVKKSIDRENENFFLPALMQLDLSFNEISDFSPEAGQFISIHLPALNQLYLQQNKIKFINLNLFQFSSHFLPIESMNIINETKPKQRSEETNGSQLEYLDLSYNQIEVLIGFSGNFSPRANKSLNQLKFVNLAHNQISRGIYLIDANLINQIVFEETFSLNETYLNNLNRLDSVLNLQPLTSTKTKFSTLCDFLWPTEDNVINSSTADVSPSGENEFNYELALTHNHLARLDKDFQSNQCARIGTLKLAENQLSSISQDAFFKLKHLTHLDLSFNQLNSLPEKVFHKTINLKSLNLAKNNLKTLDKNIFSNLNQLEELSLNYNELISFNSLEFLPNLINLNLAYNKLVGLNGTSLSGLKHLERLSLEGNEFKRISQVFSEFSSSKPVMFSQLEVGAENRDNSIKRPGKSGRNLKKLKSSMKIDKSDYKLTPVVKNTRAQRSIEATAFSNLDAKLTDNFYLDLSSNQLNQFKLDESLNCSLVSEFIKNLQFLNLRRNSIIELPGSTNSSLRCFLQLRRLDLSFNFIKTIDSSAFKPLSQLTYLDLSGNQIRQFRAWKFFNHLDLSSNQLSILDLDPTLEDDLKLDFDAEVANSNLFNLNGNPNLKLDTSILIEFLMKSNPKQFSMIGVQLAAGKNSKFLQSKHRNEIQFNNKLGMDSLEFDYFEENFINFTSNAISVKRLNMNHLKDNTNSANRLSSLNSLLTNQLIDKQLEKLEFCANSLSNQQLDSILQNTPQQIELNELNLSSNSLNSWPFDGSTAKKFSNLKFLDLSNNRLRFMIKSAQFDATNYNLTQLETLILSSNSLTNLVEFEMRASDRKKIFGHFLGNLKVIDLSHNKLTRLPLDIFDDMKNLKHLSLDHNNFEQIHLLFPELRSGRSLYYFDLSSNEKLTEFSSMVNNQKSYINVPLGNLRNFDDLIIYQNPDKNSLECKSVEYYSRFERYKLIESLPGENEIELSGSEQGVENGRDQESEQCMNLLQLIDFFVLNNLQTSIRSDYFIHLTLRIGRLREERVSQVEENPMVLSLSLEQFESDKIIDYNFCEKFANLKTLMVSRSSMKVFKFELIENCKNLNYLDLAGNEISEVDHSSKLNAVNRRLQVLNLSRNQLLKVAYEDFKNFVNLQYLDLRQNPLKSIDPKLKWFRSSFNLITSLQTNFVDQKRAVRPQIQVTGQSISIEKQPGHEASGIIVRNLDGSLVSSLPSEQREIKICTLASGDPNNLKQVCLTTNKSSDCFYWKLPHEIKTCMTDLNGEDFGNRELNESKDFKLDLMSENYSQSEKQKIILPETENSDPVLSFIDQLKIFWLKAKEFNLNQYLSTISNLEDVNSVYFRVNERFPIYTITLLKLAIVGGSLSIILLLIAMFALLTCNGRVKNKRFDGKENQANLLSEGSATTTTTSESDTIISNSNSQSMLSSSDGNAASSSSCHRNQLETIIERGQNNRGEIEFNCLGQDRAREKLAQLAYASPSPSLAPSSVETGETLQAVDSIQSNQLGICAEQQQQQPQLPQVATVMRMVKSNSANHFQQPQSHFQAGTEYGTLNSRYTNQLKSKIKTLHQKQQIYSSNSEQKQQQPEFFVAPFAHNTPSGVVVEDSAFYQQDPTTLSLLSINSALSGANANYDQLNNLCQFHWTRQQQEQERARDLVGETNAATILEFDEHQEQQFLNSGEILLIANSLPPPPPSSRAIEVMETTQQYPRIENNNNSSYIYNNENKK